jgi:uncharacterized protein YbbC (DUF1343 family)
MSVKSGLDTAAFEGLAGLKIGLVTNQTGINRSYERTAQVLTRAGVQIAAMFGPEHGYYGVEQDAISLAGVEQDRWSGAPVYSLYRAEDVTKGSDPNPFGPPPGSLEGLDALVFDIQDVGVRYYTYPTTLGILLEQVDLPVYVIDRPNPLGGVVLEGPDLESRFSSFVGRYPMIPVRHGLTLGELALFINKQLLKNRAKLKIIKLDGWQREMSWEETGLPWLATSPNLPTLTTARLYPGTCLIEGTNLSIGRGTTQPFEFVGASWITQPDKLAHELNQLERPGLYFRDTYFKPTYDRFAGQICGGVQVHIVPGTEKNGPAEMVRSGIYLVATLVKLYPQQFDWLVGHFDRLIGSDKPRQFISETNGNPEQLETLFEEWATQETHFATLRQDVLLYE